MGEELEVRRDALSAVLGTGDLRASLAVVERNVRDIVEIARQRGFVVHFRRQDPRTGHVQESDFYGLAAWQLLGMTYGVTAMVEDLRPIEGGWQAKAVARTRDGDIVGAAYGLCTQAERPRSARGQRSDHDIAAMAQSRAMRNAMRSALGAALVLAGFDWPDPDAPATDAQVGMLHSLERKLGISHEDGHARAGVASYRDLTRERAAELIERWSAEVEGSPAPPDPVGKAGEAEPEAGGRGPDQTEYGEGESIHPAPVPQPASDDQWARAAQHGLTKPRAVLAARAAHDNHVPGFDKAPASWTEITAEQLAWLLEDLLGG